MEIRGNGIAQKVLENIHKVIIGKEETLDRIRKGIALLERAQ